MTFGFGLGLPHYVAVLGGGSPPATTYFLSLTSSSTAGVDLIPLSITVDGSGNSVVFGYRAGAAPADQRSFALKLTNAGALSLSDKGVSSWSPFTGGAVDGSGNYYVTATEYIGGATSYYDPVILKLDPSFTKLAGIKIDNRYAGGFAPTIKDNANNIWALSGDDYYGDVVIKADSTLSTINTYGPFTFCVWFGTYNSMAYTSTGNIIFAGDRVTYFYCVCTCTCIYSYYPVIQSVQSTSPTTTNWAWEYSTALSYGFSSVAVDSSNNVYTNLQNTLFKFNSSGALQWQYQYTGISNIISIAFDSSGNVYCIGLNASNALVIIKVNSSGTLQYSRTLTPSTGAMYIQPNRYNGLIYISGNIMYITATYNPSPNPLKAVVLKVPTDGSLTQSISVGGVSFTYAAGAVTSSAAAYTFTAKTYQFSTASATSSSTTVTTASDTSTTAVTVL